MQLSREAVMVLGQCWWQWRRTEHPDSGSLEGKAHRTCLWMGCSKKRGIKDNSQIWVWATRKMAFPLAETGKHIEGLGVEMRRPLLAVFWTSPWRCGTGRGSRGREFRRRFWAADGTHHVEGTACLTACSSSEPEPLGRRAARGRGAGSPSAHLCSPCTRTARGAL